jgi:hypothetical protein
VLVLALVLVLVLLLHPVVMVMVMVRLLARRVTAPKPTAAFLPPLLSSCLRYDQT